MDFSFSPKVVELQRRVNDFVETHVIPAEAAFKEEMAAFRAAGNPWQHTQTMETLKEKAKAAGLWNLFLPESEHGVGLTNLEYAPLCEIMGRYPLSAEAINCSAPDTGNMEVLERYGTEEHKQRWLKPLLEGKIRSAFAMTEPDVASSDATQHRMQHPARRRPLRDQRPQVVDLGRPRSALRDPDPDGQDRSRGGHATASSR